MIHAGSCGSMSCATLLARVGTAVLWFFRCSIVLAGVSLHKKEDNEGVSNGAVIALLLFFLEGVRLALQEAWRSYTPPFSLGKCLKMVLSVIGSLCMMLLTFTTLVIFGMAAWLYANTRYPGSEDSVWNDLGLLVSNRIKKGDDDYQDLIQALGSAFLLAFGVFFAVLVVPASQEATKKCGLNTVFDALLPDLWVNIHNEH